MVWEHGRRGLYASAVGLAVRLLVDGVQVGDEQTVPATRMPTCSVFMVDTPSLPAGDHQVVAVSRILAGNIAASALIRIVVQ